MQAAVHSRRGELFMKQEMIMIIIIIISSDKFRGGVYSKVRCNRENKDESYDVSLSCPWALNKDLREMLAVRPRIPKEKFWRRPWPTCNLRARVSDSARKARREGKILLRAVHPASLSRAEAAGSFVAEETRLHSWRSVERRGKIIWKRNSRIRIGPIPFAPSFSLFWFQFFVLFVLTMIRNDHWTLHAYMSRRV